MDRKTITFLVVIFIVTFAVGFLFGDRQTNIIGRLSSPSLSSSTSPSILAVTISTNHDASAPLYKLSIEYPQFPSAPSSFNASLKDFVDTRLADFKKTVQENWNARQATRPSGKPADAPAQIYYFNVTWEAAQMNPHYISIILRMAAFEGGANTNQDIATFNYDLLKQVPVALVNFFPGRTNYLSTLAGLVREQLKSNLQSASPGYDPGQMLQEGTAPIADNFKNFTFTDDMITVYFQKYQVAPGVFGEQRVALGRNALGQ